MTFDEFATARLQPLLRYATMLTGDPHLAADLVQEVMVRAQLKWRRVSGTDNPEVYVRRMVTNAYLDWRRTSWWRRNALWANPQDAPTAAVNADHAESTVDRDEVWALLGTLAHRQRAALVLRYYEGLSDGEIADVLGCAVGTVGSLVSRGLANLRSGLAAIAPHGMEAGQ